jgi:hypothetical protein
VVETTVVPFLPALLLVSRERALLSPQDEPQAPYSQVRQQAPGEPRLPSAQQRSAQVAHQQQVPQVLCAGQPAALQQPVVRASTSSQLPLSSPLQPQLLAQPNPGSAYAPIQRENYRWSSNASSFP